MATSVSSFSELKTAVEDDATSEIIVESDITFESGIKVNTSKGSLAIDFSGHVVTDMTSSAFTNTIYIAASSPAFEITVKNATWSGRNYYGIVGVYDGNTNVSLVIEGVTYKGPQFVYNKSGSTKIVDCDIVLDKNESSTNPQELGEVNRLTISGNVVVNSNSTSNSVLWFTGTGATLVVEENAYFEVNALSTYMCYTDSSPAFSFGKNSKTFIITKNGLFYGAGSSSHIASSFTLSEGATFSATRNESNAVPMLKCETGLFVGKDATLNLFSPSAGTSALIYMGKVATLTFSSPKNVVLYNNGANIFAFGAGSSSSPNFFNLTTQRLNFWSTATTPLESAGGLDDLPSSNVHKSQYVEEVNMNITLSSSQILTIDTNVVEGDEGYPTSTSLPLLSSKVISFGDMPLSVDKLTSTSTSISGMTAAYANIRTTRGSSVDSTTASASGSFSVALSESLAIGTDIKIESNKNFLFSSTTEQVVGSVEIVDPKPLKFHAFSTMPNKTTIFRVDPDWSIEVRDTRESGGDWLLYAYVTSPLSSGQNTLDDAFVYVEESNSVELSSTPILIHRESFSQDSTTVIKWQEMEGFLLFLDPNLTYVAGDYSTTLFWEIRTE